MLVIKSICRIQFKWLSVICNQMCFSAQTILKHSQGKLYKMLGFCQWSPKGPARNSQARSCEGVNLTLWLDFGPLSIITYGSLPTIC